MQEVQYQAAGVVAVNGNHVLVLDRPERGEVRLPKGHIEPDEKPIDAAHRELAEESGYIGFQAIADLGARTVCFETADRRVHRIEHYFVMTPESDRSLERIDHEPQFRPLWLTWEKAEEMLSYEAEREWLREAQRALARHAPRE